ncbi:RNA polymerase sigma factor [Clostridium neuense]|uniref:RNA polymerase sigma factor n=1 Tax=Clostridium neuense TaxID=1728934 RepID=A0ABW8TLK2_9CLOT
MENQIAIEKQLIDKLINENLEKIFGFAVKRTEDSSEAEDLMQDILLEVYKSYMKIKYYEGKDALLGWLWTVARYTYYKWLGRKNKNSVTYIEGIGTEKLKLQANIDEKIIKDEEYNFLRREISLLSKSYREVVVSYYVHDKKFSEIAEEMDIAVTTVKWRLHEAKRMLKERMEKVKNYTERTYSPGKLSVITEGTFISPYSGFYLKNQVKSLLRQNILLYAANKTVSIEDISLELGVPRVYLEEDIEALVSEDVLKKVSNDKYRTNFLILSKESQKAIIPLLKELAEAVAKNIIEILKKYDLKYAQPKRNFKEFMWIIFPEILSDFFEGQAICNEMSMRPHGNKWCMLGFEEGEILKGVQREYTTSKYPVIGLLEVVNCEQNSNEKIISEKEGKFYIKVVGNNVNVNILSKDEEEIAYRLLNKKIIKKQGEILSSNVTVFSKEEYIKLNKEIEAIKNMMDVNLFKRLWKNMLNELYKASKIIGKKEVQEGACTLFNILHEYAIEYLKNNKLISIPKDENEFMDNIYFVIEGIGEDE